jgi:hypothetical protein
LHCRRHHFTKYQEITLLLAVLKAVLAWSVIDVVMMVKGEVSAL